MDYGSRLRRSRSSSNSRQRPKIPGPEWKAPANPRYAGVGPAVDTGNNLRKKLER